MNAAPKPDAAPWLTSVDQVAHASDESLRRALLTNDGAGQAVKEAALERLLDRRYPLGIRDLGTIEFEDDEDEKDHVTNIVVDAQAATVEIRLEDCSIVENWIKDERTDVCLYRATSDNRFVGARIPFKHGSVRVHFVNAT